MTFPTITALPTPPSRQDPTNFATEADAFLGAFPTLRSEINTAGAYIDTQVSAAATSASNASTSETNASVSASAAAASASAAATDAATVDVFADIFLGSKSSDPTLDNDGDALQEGAIYFNTVSNQLKVYNGSTWQVGVFDVDATGALLTVNNLSDLQSAPAAIQNLGITATAAEINLLDGVTASTAEINYLDGVTSSIQTQLDDIYPSFTGNAGKVLAVNSGETAVEWAAGLSNEYEEFLSSGTWTKPAGVTWVYVEAIGGGGSGSVNTIGTGGGGGGFSARVMRAADVGASETVTVGAGGAAVTDTLADGNDGGNSTFGSLVTAPGGKAGKAGISGATNGGNGGGGELGGNVDDERGRGGYSSGGGGRGFSAGGNCIKGGAGGGGDGSGGTSAEGGNGGAGVSNANATAGSVPGGGGGGVDHGSGGPYTTGAGAAGRVRVWAW